MPNLLYRFPTTMPTSPDLTSARNLTYQGVGRNVLQFQRLELLLKYLLARHQGAYTHETMADELKRREETVEKKTLGMLAGELFEQVILKPGSGDFTPADGADSGKVSHRFGITITEELHQAWQSRLKSLVEDRNRLVHLSLLTWDLNTIEGCQAAIAALDEQRGRIATEFEQVKRFRDFFTQCLKELHEDQVATGAVNEPAASA